MADLKDNFREWLIQQGTKPGTITSYLSRLQKISHQNWDMLTINIILKIVRILGNLSLFMQQADNKAKNILLSLILSNCTLKDKRLTYTINKPFNDLLSTHNHKKWKNIIFKHLKDFKNILYSIQKI